MALLANAAALAKDAAFRDRLRVALVGGAVDALGAATPPSPRLGAFAAAALHQQEAMVERLAWGVADALDKAGAPMPPTDTQLRQALAAVWSAFAGYDPAEAP